MSHRLMQWGEAGLELKYTGLVDAEERAQAVDEVAAKVMADGHTHLLIDFSEAEIHDSSDAARQAWISRAMQHPAYDGMRIAVVGAQHDDAASLELIGMVRQIPIRRFAFRVEAEAWLKETDDA